MFTTQAVDLQLARGAVRAQVDQRARPGRDQAVRAAAARPPGLQPARRTTRPTSPTDGRLAVVRRRALGAPLRHLLRHRRRIRRCSKPTSGSARASGAPTTATTRCRRCSPARATTGRSSRRRWRTWRPTARSGASRPRARAPNNTPPSVSITSPAAGATFTAPASITITAAAADSDGTIAKVDFLANGTLVGTDTTAPYSVAWTNVAAGTYNLTAVATDNGNASTTSAPVSITVSPGDPPPTRTAGRLEPRGHRRHRRHRQRDLLERRLFGDRRRRRRVGHRGRGPLRLPLARPATAPSSRASPRSSS